MCRVGPPRISKLTDSATYSRIEACIQRFRGRRRMDNDKTQLFNQYLFLGGIDPSPRQFTGLDSVAMSDMTKAEIRDAKAVDYIRSHAGRGMFYDPANAEHWDVDFEGIAAGFL